ncbi:MAG TPA: hypothetical protein PK263_01415 [bacterium]|nr:hypothetical protein [bacterium]
MARDFTFTTSDVVDSGARKKTVDRRFFIGPNTIKFVSLAVLAVLAIVYLSQSTAGASRSMKTRELESEKNALDEKAKWLEVEATRYQSLREIDNAVEKPVMEPVSSVDHLVSSNLARN